MYKTFNAQYNAVTAFYLDSIFLILEFVRILVKFEQIWG